MIKLVEKYFAINGSVKPVEEFSFNLSTSSKIIYEVIRVKNSTPIFFEQHLARLNKSIKILGLAEPDKDLIAWMVVDLLRINPVTENNIRISLIYSSSNTPDLLVYFIPSLYPSEVQINNGVMTKTLNASREKPSIKIEDLTLRERADKIMGDFDCYEVLLINNEGFITEGSRSNVFFIKENTLYTPPIEMVLGGVTRQVILNISKKLGISLREETVSIDRLAEFDGAFLTGTSPGVLPIAIIDDIKFKVNLPIQLKIAEVYSHAIANDISNFKKS